MGLGVGALVPLEHLFRQPALHGRAQLTNVTGPEVVPYSVKGFRGKGFEFFVVFPCEFLEECRRQQSYIFPAVTEWRLSLIHISEPTRH